MSSFAITVENLQVLEALAHLGRRTDNLSPVLMAIGEDLVASTKRRFFYSHCTRWNGMV